MFFFCIFVREKTIELFIFLWILHGEDLGRMQIKIYDICDLFLMDEFQWRMKTYVIPLHEDFPSISDKHKS